MLSASTYTHTQVDDEEYQAHEQVQKSVGSWLCGFYPVEVMEDVCGISWSETRRWDTDDGRVIRNLHLLLHLRQIVWLAFSFTSN